MRIDIGFGDIIVGGPLTVEFPTLLGMPAPRLSARSPESTIAEKFQVMLHRGEANTRMKDFHDLWWLAHHRAFKGITLAMAVRLTCAHRSTPVPERPTALTKAFASLPAKRTQWKAFRSRTTCPSLMSWRRRSRRISRSRSISSRALRRHSDSMAGPSRLQDMACRRHDGAPHIPNDSCPPCWPHPEES